MPRLKAKTKLTPLEALAQDYNVCCRRCHWYQYSEAQMGRVCMNPYTVEPLSAATSMFIDLVEEGKLSEVVEEALHSAPENRDRFKRHMTGAAYNINQRMSEAKRGEFERDVETHLDLFLDMGLKEVLLDHLEKMILNYENNHGDVEHAGCLISDPDTFFCKEFM